jgi:Do/DeqQ family serine protease
VFDSQKDVVFSEANNQSGINRLANFVGGSPAGDFTTAAEISTPAVVHIKATSTRSVRQQRLPSVFEDFFGFEDGGGNPFGQQRSSPQQAQSSGSGVIISADGYIVTNNHVVDGAEQLEVVTSDKKTYKATVIGTDPSSDIAVIKIDGNNLATLSLANSDNIKVGEWVLAVGNPFNLESTVTAGIISAKGRDISILKQGMQQSGRASKDSPVEAFIQTDAAVNPGNSGGALVNLRGELIGINTAIASPNGAYAGYAFAVPSSIVKKVTADIIKFGGVQRGYLGITPIELDDKKAKELDTKLTSGIYVNDVSENGAAKLAGLKKGDVILKVDGVETKSEPRFRELIARKGPGENVLVTVNRGGTLKDYTVTLRNRDGGKDLVKNDTGNQLFEKLGVELEEITSADKQKMGITNGVQVKRIFPDGDLAQATDIQDGFIILKIGDKKINNIKEFKAAVETAKDAGEEGVLICGVYKGVARNYCYGLGF